MSNKFCIKANGYTSKDFDEVKYLSDVLICVNKEGVIEKVVESNDADYNLIIKSYDDMQSLIQLNEDEILLPGFVDLHIHGPQWAQLGTALDRPLEVWLNEYTFPLETKFKDLDFAKKVYDDVVGTTLKNGTTTGVYFATVDVDPSLVLVKSCCEIGQRALVGKVAMDDNDGCPDYYKDPDYLASINETKNFVEKTKELNDKYRGHVEPIITPRFIPTCSTESLVGLGQIVQEYNMHIQTHASESDWAHEFVKAKMGKTDMEALNEFGLITSKSIIAHAPFLEPLDLKIMAKNKSTIAHCPLSNAYFANAVLPVKDFMGNGVNIGLGTDISAGYSPSIYQAIRQSVVSSKMLEDGVDPSVNKESRGRSNSAITLNNAFYMATVAGGKALDYKIGKLETGFFFDAQVVNITENIPSFYEEKTKEDLLHKVLTLAQTNNIKEVWVQGKRVV